ncbi:Fur family transcriptional regulator [Dethiosulfatarculus sandiegensis]|uniref:Fur family transcriptional regulator n=2 Tax=Dethiosulfatarculus sandiegensis TaxID=1429043 RepID=A0A0D2JZI6_9BACT|nr:Fur family transcriptional regulator [Dethiosulfatarculus sandiegensis]
MPDSYRRLGQMIKSLRGSGRRITPQRLAVLKILAASKDHPGVEMIYRQVKKDFPTTSLATVYKTVTLLRELQEVLELGFADQGSRYDGNRPSPHPHVICTKCGSIVDSQFSQMKELAREMTQETGFEITHHRLDFFGLCPKCRSS